MNEEQGMRDALRSVIFISLLEFFSEMDYIRKETVAHNSELIYNPLPGYSFRHIDSDDNESYMYEVINLDDFTHLTVKLTHQYLYISMNEVTIKTHISLQNNRYEYLCMVPTTEGGYSNVISRISKRLAESDVMAQTEVVADEDRPDLVPEWEPIKQFIIRMKLLANGCRLAKTKRMSKQDESAIMKDYYLKSKYKMIIYHNYFNKRRKKK